MLRGLRKLGRSSGESRAGIFPVGDVPELIDVVWSDVFVLKVIRVLPDVDANNRDQTSSGLDLQMKSRKKSFLYLKRILVGASSDLESTSFLVVSEPSPAGALDSNGSLGHFSLECGEGTEVPLDGLSKGPFWLATAVGRHVLKNVQ